MIVSTTTTLDTLQETLRLDPPGSYLGRGKDARAFLAAPGIVYRRTHPWLYSLFDDEAMARLATLQDEEVEAYASLPDDVGVARTLIAWVADRQVHKLIEQAPGQKLYSWFPKEGEVITRDEVRKNWEVSISALAAVPQEHYDQLIETESQLRERYILVDTAGMSDMHYDADKGFTVVDAEFKAAIPLRGKTIYAPVIGAPVLAFLLKPHGGGSWSGCIGEQARDDVVAVLEKLSNAGHHPRWWLQFKWLCLSLDYDPPVKNEKQGV